MDPYDVDNEMQVARAVVQSRTAVDCNPVLYCAKFSGPLKGGHISKTFDCTAVLLHIF